MRRSARGAKGRADAPDARVQALALDVAAAAEVQADVGHAAQPGVALEHAPPVVADDTAPAVERQVQRLGKVEEDLGGRVLDARPAPGYRRREGLMERRACEAATGRPRKRGSAPKDLDLRVSAQACAPRDAGSREDLAQQRRREDDVPQQVGLGRQGVALVEHLLEQLQAAEYR